MLLCLQQASARRKQLEASSSALEKRLSSLQEFNQQQEQQIEYVPGQLCVRYLAVLLWIVTGLDSKQ